jgi:hypothetical protein
MIFLMDKYGELNAATKSMADISVYKHLQTDVNGYLTDRIRKILEFR